MSREQDNKAIVGRWFEGFWGNPWNPEIIDELRLTKISERSTRAQDQEAEDAFERLRASGYM